MPCEAMAHFHKLKQIYLCINIYSYIGGQKQLGRLELIMMIFPSTWVEQIGETNMGYMSAEHVRQNAERGSA